MRHVTSLFRLLWSPLILYIFLCAVVIVSAFGPLFYLYLHSPAGTQFRFADGFFYDYYHYLMKIQSGMMGYAGYYNRYTDVPQPVSYGHALFPLMGMISAALGFYRADIVYLISRIVALIFLFVVMYRVVSTIFSDRGCRILAYVLFFTGTSGYAITRVSGVLRAVEPISFSGFYNALSKFPAPPHHLLASTLLLLAGILAYGSGQKKQRYVSLAVISFFIGMLQPFIGIVGILSFWFVVGYTLVLGKRLERRDVVPAIIFSVAGIGPVGYYGYLFSHVLPWTIWAHTTFGYNFQTDFLGYVTANIMYVPFLIFLIPVFKKLPKSILFYVGWGAVIPTVLYPLATRGALLSLPRLLQVQQYIPLTIAAAFGLYTVLKGNRVYLQRTIICILCVGAVLFAVLPWQTAMAESMTYKQAGYYNVFIPNDFIDALRFLETKTISESVVLTGEYMSAVIPAFTHNRVILGRADVVSDYDVKLRGLYAMFNGHPDEVQVKKYLDTYHIAYVLFGVDTPPYAEPYTSYAFFIPVFVNDTVTIVRVIR